MEISQIKHLLAKYFEGNTTLEEEKVLQGYFTEEHEIEADLLPLKNQFMLFQTGRDLKFDNGGLESKIAGQIDELDQQIKAAPRTLNISRFLIAASIALTIGLAGVIVYQTQKNNTRDTFTNPQLAYNETQRALLYVSQKMNKGIEPLSNISKINTANDKLKTLEKMDESLGMLNLVSFINRSSNLKK
jgi:hypothetical protein